MTCHWSGFALIATLSRRVGNRSIFTPVSLLPDTGGTDVYVVISLLVAFYDTHEKNWGSAILKPAPHGIAGTTRHGRHHTAYHTYHNCKKP